MITCRNIRWSSHRMRTYIMRCQFSDDSELVEQWWAIEQCRWAGHVEQCFLQQCWSANDSSPQLDNSLHDVPRNRTIISYVPTMPRTWNLIRQMGRQVIWAVQWDVLGTSSVYISTIDHHPRRPASCSTVHLATTLWSPAARTTAQHQQVRIRHSNYYPKQITQHKMNCRIISEITGSVMAGNWTHARKSQVQYINHCTTKPP